MKSCSNCEKKIGGNPRVLKINGITYYVCSIKCHIAIIKKTSK